MRKARIVVRANWFPTEPNLSLRPGAAITFAFSLALKAAKMLAVQAAMSAETAKSSSFNEAKHTPPITGMRDSHFAFEIFLPARSIVNGLEIEKETTPGIV